MKRDIPSWSDCNEKTLKIILAKPEDQHPVKRVQFVGTVQGSADVGKYFCQHGWAEDSRLLTGIDVPPEEFVVKTKEIQPQIIAMSGVLTLALESMKKTVAALTAAGLRDQVKILIGGNPVNRISCDYIGADAFTNNTDEGVTYCKNWVAGWTPMTPWWPHQGENEGRATSGFRYIFKRVSKTGCPLSRIMLHHKLNTLTVIS